MKTRRISTVGGAVLVTLLMCSICTAVNGDPAGEPVCRAGSLTAPDPAGGALQHHADNAKVVATTHELAIFYAVPSDVPYNPAVLARIKRAAADVQAWYQCASGGRTWKFAFSETVRVYNGQQTRMYYKNNGDWWGSLPSEMSAAGKPIWAPGTVTAIWAHGAGWWAGAALGCGAECGLAILGIELFPEFNNPAYSGNNCPSGSGVAAFPCTPDGAFAHELGHTVGLVHPADVAATSAVAGHSVMQTHWNYPSFAAGSELPWGFLTVERQTLMGSAFMNPAIPLSQVNSSCDVVNLPVTGSAPTAGFTRDPGRPANTFAATNSSIGATRYYWTYGDGSASSSTNALHAYGQAGNFTVLLRAMASNAMMDTAAAPFVASTVEVSSLAGPARLELRVEGQNPFRGATGLQYRLPMPGTLDLAVFDAAGRRVRTLAQGYRPAGTFTILWDGLDDQGQATTTGVYLFRLRAGSERVILRLVRLN